MKPQIPIISSSDLKSYCTYSEKDIIKADNIYNTEESMYRDCEAALLNNAIQHILSTPYTELTFNNSAIIHINVILNTTITAHLELCLIEGYKNPKANVMDIRITTPWLCDDAVCVLGFRDMSWLMTTIPYSPDPDSNYQKLYNYYQGAKQYYINIMDPQLKKHTKKYQKVLRLMIKANNKRKTESN